MDLYLHSGRGLLGVVIAAVIESFAISRQCFELASSGLASGDLETTEVVSVQHLLKFKCHLLQLLS